jgi:polyisoprenoid-binding protein YceI
MQRLLLTFLLASANIQSASAHHAFAADYEAGNEGVVEGRITEVIYKNPHARYYIDVTSSDGGTETWDLQTMNLMMLGRVGWTKDTLRVGDMIRVEGILGRNNTKRMSINVVTHEDGRVITPQRGIAETNADLAARSTSDRDAVRSEFLSLASNISPGEYELEENHAYLGFSYAHMGLSNPQLQFTEFDATLVLDGNDMKNSKVSIVIDAASVKTAVTELDDALRGPDFLNVIDFPEIVFSSTGYEEISDAQGTLTGELTIAGTTKPVSLDVTINAAAMNQLTRREMIGFAANGNISREEFGMSGFDEFVGDQLALNIQVEFQKVRQSGAMR